MSGTAGAGRLAVRDAAVRGPAGEAADARARTVDEAADEAPMLDLGDAPAACVAPPGAVATVVAAEAEPPADAYDPEVGGVQLRLDLPPAAPADRPAGRRARQLALDVAQADRRRPRPRRESPANAAACRVLDAFPDWPMPGLLLVGPAGTGKSFLARGFAARIGATCLPARFLSEVDPLGLAQEPVVLEDVDRLAPREEPHLFHLLNATLATGQPLVLTARAGPAERMRTADIASRLRMLPTVPLAPPDDQLLTAVLADAFAARQLAVDPAVVAYLARRMHRSLAEAERLAARLDREALARRRAVTRQLAADVLAGAAAAEP